jgi:hypothetical protein
VRANVGDHEIVGLDRRLEIRDDPLRQQRERVVVTSLVFRRPRGRNALGMGRYQRGQQLQRLPHVGDDLDRGLIARVDLGRGEVDVHDAQPAGRIPARRPPLDGIVADGDHEIGGREADARRVVGRHADRGERQRVVGRDGALGHEGRDDGNAGALGEHRELARGLATITPLPARISGRAASSITSAARASEGRSGDGRRGLAGASGSPSASSPATSSGSSRWQAPGFSSCARLNALRTASATTAPVSMRAFHFVNGRNTSTTSTY